MLPVFSRTPGSVGLFYWTLIFFLSSVCIQHAAVCAGENPKGLCDGCHGLKVNCTLIEGAMKAGARLKMSIRHARQWKPSSAPRPSHPAASPLISVQTLSSRRVSIRAAFTLNYTEHFGERMDAIPVPFLGVKGLISRSWFEERNCFCVYASVYVDPATMSRDAGSY